MRRPDFLRAPFQPTESCADFLAPFKSRMSCLVTCSRIKRSRNEMMIMAAADPGRADESEMSDEAFSAGTNENRPRAHRISYCEKCFASFESKKDLRRHLTEKHAY